MLFCHQLTFVRGMHVCRRLWRDVAWTSRLWEQAFAAQYGSNTAAGQLIALDNAGAQMDRSVRGLGPTACLLRASALLPWYPHE